MKRNIFAVAAMTLFLCAPAFAEERTPGQVDMTAQTKEYVILPVPQGELREASKRSLQGTAVMSSKGQRLGTLKKMIIDSKTGQIEYGVVALSNSQELVPIPWSDFQFNRETGRVVLHATKDELRPAITSESIKDLSPEMKELMKEIQLVREDAQPSSEGPGVTKRPSAGGPMGEAQAGGAGPSDPRALPPGPAPSYEGADKGRAAEPTVGSQMGGREAPLGPPEDPTR